MEGVPLYILFIETLDQIRKRNIVGKVNENWIRKVSVAFSNPQAFINVIGSCRDARFWQMLSQEAFE